MFRTRRTSRVHEAQQVAEHAWDQLATALQAAGDAARSVGRRTYDAADEAQSRVGAAAGEARRRAGAAVDALAGKRTPLRWKWIIGAAAAGLAIGWVAAAGAGRAIATAESNDSRDDLVADEARKPLNSSASPEY